MDAKEKQVGRPSTRQGKVKVGLTPHVVGEKTKVDDSTAMVSDKLQAGGNPITISEKAATAPVSTDTLQAATAPVSADTLQAATAPISTDTLQVAEIQSLAVPTPELRYDAIQNITKKRETWRLGVILDDMWTVYKGDTEDHIELLIRDLKGDTIQASLMGEDMATWKPILTEGKTYYMRNFRIFDNTSDYKISTHKFRLTFVHATRVEHIEIPGIPPTKFNFKDFSEILHGIYQPDILVDAIGVVHEIRKVVAATPSRKANVGFTIRDLSDTIIDCTLWDSLSVEFMTYYNEQPSPIVLILKHVRVKEPQGVYPTQLTNVWDGTKLVFDPAVPEISSFLSSLPNDITYLTQNSTTSNSSQFYSQTQGGSLFNSDDNFMKQARIVTLAEMKQLKVDTYCVTVAITVKIKVSNQGWFFYACKECSCKAEGKEPPYVCKKGHQTTDPIIKYKLDVEVRDSTDSTKFVFWDSSLDELTGMPAAILFEKQKQLGRSDPQEYPDTLEDLMDRKFAFRVKWQPGWGGQATVSLCRDSPLLIAKIQEHLPVAESAPDFMDVIDDNQDDIAIVNTPAHVQEFTTSDIEKFRSLEDSMLSTPNSTSTAGTDATASNLKTTGKRAASKHIQIESANLESQFSSNRTGKLIKKEKD